MSCTKEKIMKKPTKRLRLITSLFLLTLTPRIPAEIITDGTVGPPSTLSGPNYMIGHDLGTQSGSNLYHSFDKFNVDTGESATFTGPLDINNVFGRVTGGESIIDGQISSDMPNADIYLINPRGIIFDENATLNVPGSFYASSADQIILKDGTTFSATNPQNDPPILSAEPFSAFGFLDDDTLPASISITGSQFEVEAGKTFALVGGEITINDANISGGQGIEIESRNVAPITVTNSDMKVEGEGRIFFRGGKLVVMNSGILVNSESANSRIEVDATDMQLTTDSTIFLRAIGESDAGSILIGTGHLNNLTIKNSKIVDRNDGSGKGGEIQIKAANSITLEDKSLLGVGTTSSGDAGLLAIDTGSLSLTNSNIAATTSGSGNAGDIQIKATNSITLVSDSGLIVVTDEGSGDAGSLDIETGSLSLTNSSVLGGTTGTGNAGEIQIKAANSITLSEKSTLGVATSGSGDAGSLDIETGSLSLTNSDIGATTSGTGNAGDIQIKAANSITLEEGSQLVVGTFGSGDGGSLAIETGSLSLTNSTVGGASTGPGNAGDIQIKAANSITLEGSELVVTTLGSGDAGSVYIETGSLSLTNSNIAAFTSGIGSAGEIQIKATNSITLEEKSQLITFTAFFDGDAGSVYIETGSLSLTNSDIGAGTLGIGNAGDVQIKAANSITLEENSGLSVDTYGSGDGGSVDIETGSLSLTNSSFIEAGAGGTGSAGQITITASEYINIVGEGSGIFSTSGDENFPDATGNAGTITIGKKPTGESMPVPTLTVTENGQINTSTFGAGEGGEIDINVNNLEITSGGVINSSTKGAGAGGTITMMALENINIDGGSLLANTLGTGQGGEIDIDTNHLELTQGGRIDSSSDSSGHAGTITITAGKYINLVGENSGIFGTASSSGNAGQIDIFAGERLSVTTNSQISTSTESLGQGGEIKINTNQLELTQGGQIDSSSKGSGSAGKIAITASEYLKIFGEGSGIFSTSRATGNAGTITIGKKPSGESMPVPTLTVTEKGQISTETFGAGEGGEIDININNLEITQGGKIDSSSEGSGSAGKIAITASEYLKIFGEGSGIFSTASSSGNAGQINILAGGTPEDGVEIIPGSLFSASAELLPHDQGGLVLENGGKISTSTSGQGDGGTITITSSKLRLNNKALITADEVADSNQAGNIVIGAHQLDMSDSTISTSSTNANGGNILIGVRELNNNRITDSEITATAGENGKGGNLEIRGPKYLILDSTNLKADADKGGNLTVDADVFIASSDSQIEASGVLQTPEHIDVGTISLLPNQGVDVSKMVKECTAYDSEEEWSLKQVGYGEYQQKKKGCIK
jgi:filamentous hemagglutinin family protein